MELDQFKDVNLVIDKANDIFIPRQFVSQGDYKGRTLTVQITNNGSIGQVPGLTLNLNWHNEASGLTDLTAFNILDKTNSIFRIEYPDNMMTPGKVYASIQIIQDGKVTNLKQFELKIQKLAGQPVGIVEKAEFSALVAALADSNKFRTDIDSKFDTNQAESYFKSITALPETFANLAEIKAKYPSGKNGLMVAADNGHKYIWVAGEGWHDSGVYQSQGIPDRTIEPVKLTASTQNAGIASGVYYPLVKSSIINNAADSTDPVALHLSMPLGITVDHADRDKTYVLLQIFNDAEKNQYGATFGYAPRIDGHTIDANHVASYNFDTFSNVPPSQDQYGHITQKFTFDDDTSITITYQNNPAVDWTRKLYFGDLSKKVYVDACIIDESCYHYKVESRGLTINRNVDYPLVRFEVPNNGLADSKPLPAHKKALRDVKVINPEPNMSYLVAGIYNDESNDRYGVQFAKAPRIDGAAFNPDEVQIINGFETMKSQPAPLDEAGNRTYTFSYGETVLTATYNSNDYFDFSDKRLLYFEISNGVRNFFDIALISESSFIKLPTKITDEKRFDKPTWLGDSITEINSKASIHYHEIIAQKWGAKTSTNMGISGSTIGNKSDPMSVRFEKIPADTDFISVFGGVNDYGLNQPLGELGDTTNDTFYGALYVLLNGLQAHFPTIPKIFISPMHIGSEFGGNFTSTVNGLGLTQDVYEQAIVEMTCKFGVPHLSLFSDMGVTFAVKQQSDYYSADSLHPNNAGHEIIADKILQFLN